MRVFSDGPVRYPGEVEDPLDTSPSNKSSLRTIADRLEPASYTTAAGTVVTTFFRKDPDGGNSAIHAGIVARLQAKNFMIAPVPCPLCYKISKE